MVEMINHGFAADRKDVARLSANAGLDMEMVSQTYVDYLPELIAENKVSIDVIDNAVRNILRIKYRLGYLKIPMSTKWKLRQSTPTNICKRLGKPLPNRLSY